METNTDAELIFSTLFRIAETTNLARVAVAFAVKEAVENKTTFEMDLNWQNEPIAAYRQVITLGQMLWFLYCESILLVIIFYQRNENSLLWSMNVQDFGENNINVIPILSTGYLEFTHAVPSNTNAFDAHGPVLFASEGSKGERMLYADAVPYNAAIYNTTWSLGFIVTPGANDTGSINPLRYGSAEELTATGFAQLNGAPLVNNVVSLVNGQASYQWLQVVSGDVAIQITGPLTAALVAGGVLLSVSGKCSVWSHYPAEDVWDNITLYSTGETRLISTNLTIWNPNKAVPMAATIMGAKLVNPNDDVAIRQYCLAGNATNYASTLGVPTLRKTANWQWGSHFAVLPADGSYVSFSEVLSSTSSNSSSGVFDAAYRRSGQGLDGVRRGQTKVAIISMAAVQGATVLEGMYCHFRVAAAWDYTTSKQSGDARMPGYLPSAWIDNIAIAQATYPIFEDLDDNGNLPPLKFLMSQMSSKWALLRAGNRAAHINGQGIANGLSPAMPLNGLKREAEDEVERLRRLKKALLE